MGNYFKLNENKDTSKCMRCTKAMQEGNAQLETQTPGKKSPKSITQAPTIKKLEKEE